MRAYEESDQQGLRHLTSITMETWKEDRLHIHTGKLTHGSGVVTVTVRSGSFATPYTPAASLPAPLANIFFSLAQEV